MPMQRLKTTPFHPRTEQLMQGAEWRRWGGYQVASCYEMAPDREYYAVRASCAMFDVSALAKYSIRGPQARDFLQRLITRNIANLKVGEVLYAPWCDSRGKVIDDGTFACLADDHFQMTAAEQGEAWIRKVARGFAVTIDNISDDYGVLALQGPTSLAVLRQLVGQGVAQLAFSQSYSTEFESIPLWISRTGYTGDLGYEVWVPREHGVAVWDKLVAIGQAYALYPAGIWALDVARIEAGLLMLDVEYTSALSASTTAQTSSPFELGLGWSVHFKKGDFIGRKALLQEKESLTTPYHYVGCVLDTVAYREAFEELGLPPNLSVKAWRGVHPLFDEAGEQVGYATCGTWSPTLQKYLMLAQVHPRWSNPGQTVIFEDVIDRRRVKLPGTVEKLPFFNTDRKKDMYVEV
jgi:aminomethyltransferase